MGRYFAILTLITTNLIFNPVKAQKVNWLVGDGGPAMERVWDITLLESGNVAICGQYNETLSVGGNEFVNNGASDIFVSTYNSEGEVQWVYTFGGSSEDVALGIASDHDDNLFVTGYFCDSLFLMNDTLVAQGWDIFVVKINALGELVQYVHPMCDGSELGYGIDVNPNGEVFITGWYQNSIDFGNEIEVASNGGSDIFLAKYNAALEIQWAKTAGTEGVEYGYKVAADGNGNSYVTGVAGAGVSFDDFILDSGHVFIAKYNSMGDVVALNYHTGDGVNDISVNRQGVGHIGGRLTGRADFYASTPFFIESTNGSDDAYVASFDEQLNWNWAVTGVGDGSNKGRAVATAVDGSVNFAGSFQRSFSMGDFSGQSIDETDAVFFAQLDTEGNVRWMKHSAGFDSDVATSIVASDSRVFVTGWYSTELSFDSYTVINGGIDFFLTSMDYQVGVVDSNSLIGELSVFPNPSLEEVRIDVSQCGRDVSLSIYDLFGRPHEVSILQENNFFIQIGVGFLHSGVYVVRVVGTNGTFYANFVKE